MRVVKYEIGTAPEHLLVVSGVGRALNPTDRSGKPQHTNLSSHTYDDKNAKHRGTPAYKFTERGIDYYDFVGAGLANTYKTTAFDTPVRVWRKVTGWMTVAGGRDGLTMTYAPDAMVVLAVIEVDGEEVVVQNMPLTDYLDTYC